MPTSTSGSCASMKFAKRSFFGGPESLNTLLKGTSVPCSPVSPTTLKGEPHASAQEVQAYARHGRGVPRAADRAGRQQLRGDSGAAAEQRHDGPGEGLQSARPRL